jgi:hypothetical protein
LFAIHTPLGIIQQNFLRWQLTLGYSRLVCLSLPAFPTLVQYLGQY